MLFCCDVSQEVKTSGKAIERGWFIEDYPSKRFSRIIRIGFESDGEIILFRRYQFRQQRILTQIGDQCSSFLKPDEFLPLVLHLDYCSPVSRSLLLGR